MRQAHVHPHRLWILAVTAAAALNCTMPGHAMAATVRAYAQIDGFFCDSSARCDFPTRFDTGPTQFNTVTDATTSTVVAAATSYLDPRLGTTNSVYASATGGAGHLHLAGGASASSSPPLGSGSRNLMKLSARAEASTFDTLTIAAPTPSLVGLTATVTAGLRVTGSLTASAVNANPGGGLISAANWRISYAANGSGGGSTTSFPDPRYYGSVITTVGGTSPSGVGDGGIIPLTFNIRWGVPFTLEIAAAVDALAILSNATAKPLTDGLTVASAAANYGSTFSWNGIDSITSGGTTYTTFSVTSQSGANYAQAIDPVPVPPAVLMLASALPLMARFRKHA
jgi:hypothetical protein